MNEPIATVQETDLGAPKNSTGFNPAYRPWYVYVMAVWAFLGTGSFLMSLARMVSNGDQSIIQFSGIAILIFNIALTINIIKMKKTYLIIFGGLCALLALMQGYSFLSVFFTTGFSNPIIFLLLFYIVPSILLAYLSLRPNFLSFAVEFAEQKNKESIRKKAMKGL